MEKFSFFQEILNKKAEFMNSTTKLCCGHKFSLHQRDINFTISGSAEVPDICSEFLMFRNRCHCICCFCCTLVNFLHNLSTCHLLFRHIFVTLKKKLLYIFCIFVLRNSSVVHIIQSVLFLFNYQFYTKSYLYTFSWRLVSALRHSHYQASTQEQ